MKVFLISGSVVFWAILSLSPRCPLESSCFGRTIKDGPVTQHSNERKILDGEASHWLGWLCGLPVLMNVVVLSCPEDKWPFSPHCSGWQAAHLAGTGWTERVLKRVGDGGRKYEAVKPGGGHVSSLPSPPQVLGLYSSCTCHQKQWAGGDELSFPISCYMSSDRWRTVKCC